MSIGEIAKDTLLNKPFIGKIVEYTDTKDLAFGQSITRECNFCLMRTDLEGRLVNDCNIANKTAHKYFGIAINKRLPTEIGGKQVGNYCPAFTNFLAE